MLKLTLSLAALALIATSGLVQATTAAPVCQKLADAGVIVELEARARGTTDVCTVQVTLPGPLEGISARAPQAPDRLAQGPICIQSWPQSMVCQLAGPVYAAQWLLLG